MARWSPSTGNSIRSIPTAGSPSRRIPHPCHLPASPISTPFAGSISAPSDSFDALTAQLDKLRRSDNLFFAVRLDGRFAGIHLRVACKTASGTPLTEATAHQAEFKMTDVPGTIVGFWSPPYARSINVAGWHLHFLTDDRKGGGHLLGCSGAGLEAKMEDLDDLRLAIPETTQFLHADLTQDPSRALEKAERAH